MTQPLEIIEVPKNANEVACDGGNPALGHPRTFYSFDGKNEIRCDYCERIFVKKP